MLRGRIVVLEIVLWVLAKDFRLDSWLKLSQIFLHFRSSVNNRNMESNFVTKTNEHIVQDLQAAGYEPKHYEARPAMRAQDEHTADQIQAALTLMRSGKEAKKKRIDFALNDPSKNKVKGRGLVDLVKAFNRKNDEVLESIKTIEHLNRPENYTARQLGIPYQEKQAYDQENNQALNEMFELKAGFPRSAENLKMLRGYLAKQGVVLNHELTNNKLRDLVLLDDWSTIAKHAVPLIIQHGPKVIDWLWNKFVKRLEGWNAPGQDAGMWIGDYSNNNVFTPSKQAISGGSNLHGSLFRDRSEVIPSRYTYDAVNTDYVATFICPERYGFRQPTAQQLKTGVVMGSTEIILVSDTNGATMITINPNNISLGAGAAGDNFFAMANPANFDPITGNFDIAGTSVFAGPLAGAVDSLDQIRVTAFSVQITPITSMTTSQGNYQLAYFQQSAALGTVSAARIDGIGQQSYMINQYYQTGNSLTSYRQLRIPDINDYTYTPLNVNSSQYEYMNTLITGAQPNTRVAKVDIFYVCEVIPTPGQAQLTVMDYPQPGIRTNDCLANIVYAFSALHSLTFDQAFQLAERIKTGGCSYDEVLSHVLKFSVKYAKPKQMSFLTSYTSPGDIMPDNSTDFVF